MRALFLAIGALAAIGCVSWVPESLLETPKTIAPLESCYRASLFGQKHVPANATFGVTVAPDGKASFVGLLKMSPRDLELETCLIDHLLQKEYGFRYAEKCYIGALTLGEVSRMSVERSDASWCRNPYVFPP